MHIGYLHHSEPFIYNGRLSANSGFARALFDYCGEHKVTTINPRTINTKQLAVILKDHPLDVLHYSGPDLYRALEYKRVNPKPLVVTGLTHSLGYDPYMQWLYLTLLAGPTYSDALICTSEAAVHAILKMQEEIPLRPINLPLLRLGIRTSDFYKGKWHRDAVNLIYFGRLCSVTKVDLEPLLHMVETISTRTQKKIQLTLAGAGAPYAKYLNDLKSQFSYPIIIEESPTEERKIELLAGSDIFLAPSNNTQETFGISLLEAMASGLPVVAYDWSGYRSLITDKEDGFLIPTTLHNEVFISPSQNDAMNQVLFSSCVDVDKEEFIKKTLLLIDNDSLRQAMSDAALLKSKMYDWSVVMPEFFELWGKLVKLSHASVSKLKTLDYFHVFSHYATSVK